jgi:hypothetical protein
MRSYPTKPETLLPDQVVIYWNRHLADGQVDHGSVEYDLDAFSSQKRGIELGTVLGFQHTFAPGFKSDFEHWRNSWGGNSYHEGETGASRLDVDSPEMANVRALSASVRSALDGAAEQRLPQDVDQISMFTNEHTTVDWRFDQAPQAVQDAYAAALRVVDDLQAGRLKPVSS